MMRGTQEKPLPAFNKLWKPAEKCDRTKLLNLHRPTPISEFKNTIPRPKYRPIKDALPFWEIRELNEKIPMYYKHTPSGPIVFHRGLMGDNPLKSSFKLDFLLNDPHCHEVSNTYNPLHDPHLKHWLTSNNNRKFLHRQGLITDDMDVICNLKEFNEYRRFLWQVHNNITMWRLKSKEEKKIERKKIFNANQNHKNEVAKKLKHLKYIMSKREPQNSSKLNNNSKNIKLKCQHPNKPSQVKKIETQTVFGKKNGMIDQTKYKRTFIKGSPNDYPFLFGLYNDLFE